WSARFAVICTAFGNPADLAAEVGRMRPWIRRSGWPVVAGLVIAALAASWTDFAVGSILAALAMGGVGCLVFLDPAVERAAFPHAAAVEAPTARRRNLLR